MGNLPPRSKVPLRRGKLSRYRYVRLRRLFPSSQGDLLNSRLARICVLFEDLAIETAGNVALEGDVDCGDSMQAAMDRAGMSGRQIYFLRRAISTLREFAEAIRLLDSEPSFVIALNNWRAKDRRFWEDLAGHFREEERFLKELRNDVGGHFGSTAAMFAIRNFGHNSGGGFEVNASVDGKTAAAVLGFASEIAATALLKHAALGASPQEKMDWLVGKVVATQGYSIQATYLLAIYFLWPRTSMP